MQLSRECLRYMYRLLFLFYIEARPDLGYAPITAEAYLKGYSLEHLRELEQTPLTTPEAQDGTYFHESLKQLFTLIWEGFPKRGTQGGHQDELLGGADHVLDTGFTIAPLQGHLFDPKQTPLLGSVKLRNRVLQRVIELMSLSRGTGKQRRGRISYGTLGINQLGAVYESLLSFRGFFAEEDLYEVRPDPKRKKDKPASDEDEGEARDDTEGGDDDDGDDAETRYPPPPRRRRTPRWTRWTRPTSCPPARSVSTPTPSACLAASRALQARHLHLPPGRPSAGEVGLVLHARGADQVPGRARAQGAAAHLQDGRRHPQAHRVRAGHGQRGVPERSHQPAGRGLPARPSRRSWAGPSRTSSTPKRSSG
jgi:hypothetical protein